MSGFIKNVAIVGASGNLGTAILQQLVPSGKFNIKVLRRNSSSPPLRPEQAVDVDFESVNAVKSGLVTGSSV
ncbi:Uncharacterized protein TPAR_05392 [Tolypocladium paradoxum]|uniref:NAD(P)-binding domain-containing protein n=1 Tax=Tolypocladium paradoxum TaxID=94208 RepID=A0A2S4KW63_9HYPO|nr:Uncharacterized protein TPAR_05392 [Tolypocladium paradoxum]